jgi:hypothetical protein
MFRLRVLPLLIVLVFVLSMAVEAGGRGNRYRGGWNGPRVSRFDRFGRFSFSRFNTFRTPVFVSGSRPFGFSRRAFVIRRNAQRRAFLRRQAIRRLQLAQLRREELRRLRYQQLLLANGFGYAEYPFFR